MKPPTRGPVFACMYHGLCDVARGLGYALACHGTVMTDFDLVAIPWIEEAATPQELVDALMKQIGACGYGDLLRRESCLTEEQIGQILVEKQHKEPEHKPHGRLSWNLYCGEGMKVDLSIMPRTMPNTPGDGACMS